MSLFVGATTGTVGAVSSFNVAKPAGVVDGDLLILSVYEGHGLGPGKVTTGTLGAAGWTSSFGNVLMRIASGEPSSWTFTVTGGTMVPAYEDCAVILTAWRLPIFSLNVNNVKVADPSPRIEDNGSTPYSDLVSTYGEFAATFYPCLVVTIGAGYLGRGGYFHVPPSPYNIGEPTITFNDATVVASVPSIVPGEATTGTPGATPTDHTVSAFSVAETHLLGSAVCDYNAEQRTALTPHTTTIADPNARAGTVDESFGWWLEAPVVRIAFRAAPFAEYAEVPPGCAPYEVTFDNTSPNAADVSCWWWHPDWPNDPAPVYTTFEPTHTYATPGTYEALVEGFSAKFNAYLAAWSQDIVVQNCDDFAYWGTLANVRA